MGRPKSKPTPLIEVVEIPAQMMRGLDTLTDVRVGAIFRNGMVFDRPLRQIVRDIYLQGLADGYEVAQR